MLKTRVFTALLLLAVFIPALFYTPLLWWASITLLVSLLGLSEWAGMLLLKDSTKKIYLVFSAGLGGVCVYYLWLNGLHQFFYLAMGVLGLVSVFWLVVVPVWLWFTTKIPPLLLSLVLGITLIGGFWLALVCAKQANPALMLIIISTAWLSDSAAYFVGKRIGKHKLAPAISPNKTWEGVVGAFVAVTLYAILLKLLGVVTTWWVLPCLWIVTFVGIYGDLLESLYKRQANLKDSGQLLPGHGGLLDRVDSMLSTLPVGLLLVYYINNFSAMYSF